MKCLLTWSRLKISSTLDCNESAISKTCVNRDKSIYLPGEAWENLQWQAETNIENAIKDNEATLAAQRECKNKNKKRRYNGLIYIESRKVLITDWNIFNLRTRILNFCHKVRDLWLRTG